MLGGMFLQPLVGYLLDWSAQWRATNLADNLQSSIIYTASDYRFALSIVPIGIIIAAILTLFLKETHASIDNE